MTLLHDPRQAGPSFSPPRARGLLLIVVGVVALLVVVVALTLRAGRGDNATGSNTIRGSGIASAQTRAVPPFTAVELAGSNSVVVQVGSPRSVVVHADTNLINHVHTAVRAGVLLIWDSGSFSSRAPMRVSVGTPTLTRVSLTGSGSGTVTVDGVDSPAFAASLLGSGTVRATGRTGHLEATLPGSGQLDLQQLVARVVTIRLAGSGEVRVQATGSLDAVVSGSGAVLYTGSPASVTKMITGTGAIEGG